MSWIPSRILLWRAGSTVQPPSVEQHRAAADVLEVMRHFEIIEKAVSWNDFLEQLTQFGNVPLATV